MGRGSPQIHPQCGGEPPPNISPPSVPLAPQFDPQEKYDKSSTVPPSSKTNSWLRLCWTLLEEYSQMPIIGSLCLITPFKNAE